MKRFVILFSFIIVTFNSCEKHEDNNFDSLASSDIEITNSSTCGDYKSFDLIAGQYIDAGDIKIWNDAAMFYIEINTTDEWLLNGSHVYVGNNVPATKKGTPIPGKFPFFSIHEGITSYIYAISLSDLDDCYSVYIHAVVTRDGSEETAWGGNCEFDSKRWGYYICEYCTMECQDLVFTLKTWTKNSGWCVTTGISIAYSDWCSVMGFNHLEDGIVVDMINSSKTKIGEVYVSKTDDVYKFHVTLENESEIIKHSYLFVGTIEELEEYGVCPNYKSFPYIITEYSKDHIFNIDVSLF